MDFQFHTPRELAEELGARLRTHRINRRLEQAELSARAGISERTLRGLELGQGSTVETLLRVMKALDLMQGLEALAPRPTVDPLAMLKSLSPPQRVRKRKGASR